MLNGLTFLEKLTDNLIERVGLEGLKDYTIVFPMHRAGLFMREYLRQYVAQQALRPVMSPNFATIDELVGELSQLKMADEIASICYLHNLYNRYAEERQAQALSLDVFWGWGKQLLTDFSNVDISLVDAERLFANSMDAHKLEKFELPEEVRARLEALVGVRHSAQEDAYRFEYQQLWAYLPTMYRELNAWHRSQGVGYNGARLRWVVEHFETLDLGKRKFVFAGFNYLLKGEKKLMQLLQDRSLYYWDYNADFHTNKDVYRFIREHIEKDGLVNAMPAEKAREGKQKVEIIATSGAAAQSQYVHEWVKDKKGKTAVVIADEGLLEPVIYALPDTVAQRCNITKGYPLRQTKVYADIVAFLTDPKHDLHPGDELYGKVLRRLIERLVVPKIENVGEMSWQELLTAESVYQARKVVERLAVLLEQGEILKIESLKTLRNITRRILDTVNIPFHGEPVTDLQVIGVLETRVLDFENLLVLNVEEGVLPRVERDMSFIPYYLRKYYGIETADESAAAYAYNFFRMLRRAKNVTLMFSQASTGMGQKTMSRFLMQILTSDEFEVTKKRISEGAKAEEVDIPIPEIMQWKGGHLSASSINTYLNCPRQFYWQYVMKLRETVKPSPIMEANTFGTLVHGMLQAMYEHICKTLPCVVTKEMIEAALADKKVMEEALEASYQQLNKDYEERTGEKDYYKAAEHPIENQVAVEHVKRTLQHDAKEEYLEIVAMEMDMDFFVTVEGRKEPLRIEGKIDRLDRVMYKGEKVLRVVDYKAGKFKADKMATKQIELTLEPRWEVEMKVDPSYVMQTLLYCKLVMEARRKELSQPKQNVVPALLFTSQAMNEAYSPYITIGGEEIGDYSRWEDTFTGLLKSRVEEIVKAQSFPMCSLSICSNKHCAFKALCHRPEKTW